MDISEITQEEIKIEDESKSELHYFDQVEIIQEQLYNSSMFKKEPKFEYENSQQFVTMDNSSINSFTTKSEMLIGSENDISSQTNLEFDIKKEELHSIYDLPGLKMELQNCNKRFLFAAKKWQPHFGKFYGTCTSCGKFFYDKLLFLNHFYIYHCFVNLKKSVNLERNKSATKPINHQNLSILNKQIRAHNLPQQIDLKKYIKIEADPKPFKCKICSKCFTHSSNLKIHIRTHTDEKSFICKICSKRFTLQSDLIKHIRTHSGEKPFKCKICSKCFTQNGNLKQHIIGTHTHEKPFKCKFCSKCFTFSSNLNRHIRNHSGEKPFKCKICSKSFTQSSNLNRHIRTHTDEKPFKCKICSKFFRQSSTLKTHIKTHTGEKRFKCKICSKCFTQSTTLKCHIRTHTNEKPFNCKICLKCFSQSSILNRHIRTHTDEKPFKCKICTKCFSRSSSLKTHVRSHNENSNSLNFVNK